MAYEIKARTLGEILDAAFQIYRNHFGTFAGVTLCVVVPSGLAVSLVSWLVTGNIDLTASFQAASQGTQANGIPASPDLAHMMRAVLAILLSAPITVLGAVLQDAVLTLTIADAYLGRPLSVRSGFQRSFQSLGSLLGASVLKSFGVMFGLLCLIVPGILLMIRWLFSTPAIIIESKHASESLARSRELVQDHRGRLLLLVVVMAIIGMGLHFAIRAIVPDAVERVPLLAQLLRYAQQILVAPISSAAFTLAYFDLRVRKEGFDLERLAQGLGEAPSVATQGV